VPCLSGTKKEWKNRAGGMNLVVEYLPCKCSVQSSNTSTSRGRKDRHGRKNRSSILKEEFLIKIR
jgi:hypothetical protein